MDDRCVTGRSVAPRPVDDRSLDPGPVDDGSMDAGPVDDRSMGARSTGIRSAHVHTLRAGTERKGTRNGCEPPVRGSCDVVLIERHVAPARQAPEFPGNDLILIERQRRRVARFSPVSSPDRRRVRGTPGRVRRNTRRHVGVSVGGSPATLQSIRRKCVFPAQAGKFGRAGPELGDRTCCR
jgi:hypothetical protein